MIIAATRYGSAGGSSKLPAYTYTGLAPLECKAETGDDWELVFQRPVNAPSGPTTTITFSKNVDVEIFAVGGGASGSVGTGHYSNGVGWAEGGKGGNGGETKTATKQLVKDVAYSVTVGGAGMSTSFDDSQHTINVTAASGTGAAGGVGAKTNDNDAGDGVDGDYAFGDANTLYNTGVKYGAGGGGGGATAMNIVKGSGSGGTTGGGAGGTDTTTSSSDLNGKPGADHTGAGGGGCATMAVDENAPTNFAVGVGGSGIVIIRNVRT